MQEEYLVNELEVNFQTSNSHCKTIKINLNELD